MLASLLVHGSRMLLDKDGVGQWCLPDSAATQTAVFPSTMFAEGEEGSLKNSNAAQNKRWIAGTKVGELLKDARVLAGKLEEKLLDAIPARDRDGIPAHVERERPLLERARDLLRDAEKGAEEKDKWVPKLEDLCAWSLKARNVALQDEVLVSSLEETHDPLGQRIVWRDGEKSLCSAPSSPASLSSLFCVRHRGCALSQLGLSKVRSDSISPLSS